MSKYMKYGKKLRRYLIMVLMIYIIAFGFFVIFQRAFLYFPNDTYSSPEQAKVTTWYQEINATPKDGVPLKGWYAPAKEGKPTIVFFHGNADSIRKASFIGQLYAAQGYGFVLTEYRGYSGFKGLSTEEGLYDDGRAFVRAVHKSGVPMKDIILLGHSLGSGVATQLATEFDVGGLMLLAPLLSVADMAGHLYPYFPSKYFVFDEFDNLSKITKINAPLLIVHGTWDVILPHEQSVRFFEAAVQPKTFVSVPRGGHNNLFVTPFAQISMKWMDAL